MENKQQTTQSSPRIKKKEEIPTFQFRRREDQLRYELFDKVISLSKWLIILILAILFFFYKTISGQNQTDQYQIKLINEAIEKINHINTGTSNQIEVIPGTCMVCHPDGTPSQLKLRNNFTQEDFRAYVRGERRIPENKVMPKFGNDKISDQQIDKIYIYLKHIK